MLMLFQLVITIDINYIDVNILPDCNLFANKEVDRTLIKVVSACFVAFIKPIISSQK